MKKSIIAVIVCVFCATFGMLNGCSTTKGALNGAANDVGNAAHDVSKAIPG